MIALSNMRLQKNAAVSKLTTEDPNLAERFNRVLGDTVAAMEEAGVRYVFIGGIASGGLGRPRSTSDIDLFVIPEQAELALRALAKHGFKTEKTDPSWLYKGFKEEVLVDIIFKSKGDIYLDSEMYQRMITAEFHGRQLRLVSPEDLLIIKAAAHSELTPSHWHDAIALLSYATIDWQYLIKRARRAPRRILSLLLYAQSNDIWVPNSVIQEMYAGIFESAGRTPPKPPFVPKEIAKTPLTGIPSVYIAAHIRERLAEDPRTNEMDIKIEQQAERLSLHGEVPTTERREAVERVVREACPLNAVIENRIRVSHFQEPAEIEEIK